ncbi:hypothetical protein NF27_IP00120 [Candidatus Jidaibacter acanthamoeba]|uniref:TraG P-loop domain-containing protein n=1 Tax=Candidatus Jidaibacter acanthamoebae TaxID=86105 RepID=A0A0C1QFA9_9RICK|nr:TraC family protein [Candidatus Jidaibacter acanthamoeba]KIE04244.1 hypothetical protein NF27_IP00120 [Candidatus Jidaibacter acanthamoeba]
MNTIKQYFRELREDIKSISSSYKARKAFANDNKEKYKDPSLLDFISYRKYHVKYGVFENDTTLSCIIKTSHFSGVDNGAKQVLRGIINNGIPQDCIVQVINYASPRVGDLVDYWHRSGANSELFKRIADERKVLFEKGSWESILGERRSFVVRNFELYFCFSIPKPKTSSGIKDGIYRLEALKDKIREGLKGINCDVININDKDLASLVGEFINPDKSLYKNSNLKKKEDVREYFSSSHQVEMVKDGVVFSNEEEKFKYLVFEVVDLPDTWRIENSVDLMGQFDGGFGLPCPFYITFGFQLKSKESSERSADKYRMIKTKQGESKLPMFFPKMIEEIEDWQFVSAKLNQNERIGKGVMYIVACINNSKLEDKYEQIFIDHFARLNFSIEKVKYDTVNSFLTTLPFGIGESWQILDQLKVSAQLLSCTCMSLLPVFADIQNYGSPLMMFAGRRGQIFFFDNYKTADDINGNFNGIVVGKSGSGKSVWLQEYTAASLRFGGQVIILDDGRSFQNICGLLGGDFVDFGGGSFCINPFSLYKEHNDGESDEEYKEFFEEPFIDLIVSILCIVVNIDKNDTISSEIGLYKAVMADAVIEVLRKKGRSGGFADIRDELINNAHLRTAQTKDIADKIAYVLRAYSNGRYAKYFNGESSLNIEQMLSVFELSDLEHSVVLQNSVLITVVFLVYTKMRARERRLALIIDEAWRLLTHPAIKAFLEGIARRTRKYNGCLIVATQFMKDFDESRSPAAAAILSQSDWRIILSASGEDELMLKEKLGMNDAEISIVTDLAGLKGAYSEFMIRHKNNSWQIGRLMLDKFSAKLYSTTAEEVVQVRNMRKQGFTVEQCVERLM